MEMTNDEIRRNYKAAKYPKRQLTVLAELNGCSVAEIERICGVEKKDKAVEAVLKMLYDFLDDIESQIAPLKEKVNALEEEYKKTVAAIDVVGKVGA